jgi:hypothetical protein
MAPSTDRGSTRARSPASSRLDPPGIEASRCGPERNDRDEVDDCDTRDHGDYLPGAKRNCEHDT